MLRSRPDLRHLRVREGSKARSVPNWALNGTLLDNFNRANAVPPGAPWAATGIRNASASALGVVSNVLTNTGHGYLVGPYGPNVDLYCDVVAIPSAGGAMLLYVDIQEPATTTFDGYSVHIFNNTGTIEWRLRRIDNGVNATLISKTSGEQLVAGESVGISRVGNEVIVNHKAVGIWKEVIRATDATYAAGAVGVEFSTAGTQIDNLRGGTR